MWFLDPWVRLRGVLPPKNISLTPVCHRGAYLGTRPHGRWSRGILLTLARLTETESHRLRSGRGL